MNYECTEPTYTANGAIDVIWNHPDHGPIPFTASPDDPMAYGPVIFAAAVAGDYGPVAPYVPPEGE